LLVRLARRLAARPRSESVTSCLRLALHLLDEQEAREAALQGRDEDDICLSLDRKRGT
jgi:hypothetical protein